MRALRNLVPSLPRSVWALEGAGFVDSVGTGLIYPFLIIYLHDVRGLGYAAAGAVLAGAGAAGFACGPAFGLRIDRRGPRGVIVLAMLVGAAGYVALAAGGDVWVVVLALIASGISSAGFWPAHSTMIAALSQPEGSHAAFSLSSLARNAGWGVGAAIGGLVATTARPETYTWLLLANAASFVVCAAIVRALPRVPGQVAAPGAAHGLRSFDAALHDRALLALVGLQLAFVCFTVAAFDFLGPYLKAQAGVDESAIGLIWLVGSAAVVAFQLPTARFVSGRRRMRWIGVASGLWAAGLCVFAVAGLLDNRAAVAVALGGVVVYSIGECVQAPLHPALVGEIAPDAHGGRYQTLLSMSWDLGALLGPGLAGLVFAASQTGFWAVFATGALLTGVGALATERLLPERTRLTPRWQPAAGTP